MNKELANHYYTRFINTYNNELKLLEEYKIVNKYLRANDWLFISPLFFQGYELKMFLKLSDSKDDNKAKILDVIFKKFYDLKYNASFMEGYCNRCNYIKPFLKSIENSLILTFQRDYEGSIKTIIPIIEGVLRKYLISEKGFCNEAIKSKHLKNSFKNLEEDITKDDWEFTKNFKTENNVPVYFSDAQIHDLIRTQKEYFGTWFSFVDEFVRNSFYLNTNGNAITNEVNRHSILHEFGLDFNYNLENYIKIYFLLQFLTWAFLQKEKKSLLCEIDSQRYLEKIVAYENIIKHSDKVLYEKHILLKNYSNYDEAVLKQQLPVFKNETLPKKLLKTYKLKRKFDELLWRKQS